MNNVKEQRNYVRQSNKIIRTKILTHSGKKPSRRRREKIPTK
jgi:hypothetical protein